MAEPAPAPAHFADVVLYSGLINRQGYEDLSDLIETPKHETCLLVLCTAGGDPHAGYRIARALRHHYKQLLIYVPAWCKSAGTLICMAADELIIDDRGELGPLDVQFQKADELFEQTSGLDLQEALNILEQRVASSFQRFMIQLKTVGLGTKLASALATELVTDPIRSIYDQIDPLKLGEFQRAVRIANEYGERLNSYVQNMKDGALATIIAAYPAHAFVIDRKEASALFHRVRKPTDVERQIRAIYRQHLNPMVMPSVQRLPEIALTSKQEPDHATNTQPIHVPTSEAGAARGDGAGAAEINGAGAPAE